MIGRPLRSDADPDSCLVIGATGMVGGNILTQLRAAGRRPVALARTVPDEPGWVSADINDLAAAAARLPQAATVFATASVSLLAGAVPILAAKGARRIVVFTTTSIMTKLDSPVAAERIGLQKLVEGEHAFIAACTTAGVAWTILRPTMIYAEGMDINVTRIARLIRRFGVLPISGRGEGLRQPVHAEDLATGAIAAARSPQAANKTYVLNGADTLSYREMVGRIFDGLGRPRRIIAVPAWLWRAAFVLASPLLPGANAAMGDRMSLDMAFDSADAVRDFGWQPRGFRPRF